MNDSGSSSPSRFIDVETAVLRMHSNTWKDFQTMRKALDQRDAGVHMIEGFEKLESAAHRELTKALRRHPLWPWLKQFPGLGGAHTATLIGQIGDPRRFPGQACTLGHIVPPLYEVGERCPLVVEADAESASHSGDESGAAESDLLHDIDVDAETRCPGTMLAARTTSGTRSVWHYCGLHVVDGHSPRKTKGRQANWNPIARTAVLQPNGIADQIVRLNVPVYAKIYRDAVHRLNEERGLAASDAEVDGRAGEPTGAEAVHLTEAERSGGLRPFQIDRLARKIAAKAFVGDLLRAWKEIA